MKRRINLIPIFITIIVLIGAWIAVIWYQSGNQHRQLAENGIVTTASVESMYFTANQHAGTNGNITVVVSNPQNAQSLFVTVQYLVNNTTYTEKIGTTISLQRNDHVQVYSQAKNGVLTVRYLKSDPAIVRPEAEFTDPKDNPYFGGK